VPEAWTKVDIIHHLASCRGAASYLEICTPTTGNRYAEIDQSRFRICDRLMSLCPDDYNDGLAIDFRSATKDIDHCFERIVRSGRRYDVILVDPWHEYETSMSALVMAGKVLADGGTIVVHDCLPTCADEATPNFRPGAWCGVTFKAYLDFLLADPSFGYMTVDTDYGCGLMRRSNRLRRLVGEVFGFGGRRGSERPSRREALAKWKTTGADYEQAFRYLREHAEALLNLCGVDAFRSGEASWVHAR